MAGGAVAAWLAPQVLRVAPTTNLGDHRHEVVVYGDDFMAEITPHLQQVTMNDERMLVHVHSVPLAGLCDISRAVRADADVPHASAVFVEFQGSGLTPCAGAHGAFGSPTHLAALRHELVDLAHATARPDRPLVITAPPPSPTVAGRALQRAVHSIAVEVAKQIPGVIVDDAAAEGVGGTTWTSSLPCLPADRRHPECSGGSAPVRGPDRTTLCTTSYSSLVALIAGCTSFSNGVNRYTAGLVTTIAVHG